MININHPDFTLNPVNPLRVKQQPYLAKWNDSPVLSIVTPFYNTGPIFNETAQSIFSQTLQQWEWLIINDGSTDPQSIEILTKYRQIDPRIKVIDHSQNRGLSAARNTGFSHARCELVLLLDSDDLLEPTAAEKWWWFLETHPQYSFVASYHVAFGGLNYLWTGGFHDGALNAQRNRVSMMCVVRKSVHNEVGGFDETIRGGLEDWEFWMRCADHGYWGTTVPEYLAWYRLRQDHSDRWKNLEESRLNEFRTLLQVKYPKLYQGGFPNISEYIDYDLTTIDLQIPTINQLKKNYPHLLMILPWLVMGGSERFSLNLIDQLISKGWTISVLTTSPSENPWLHEFEKRTPSVYILPNFIPIRDYPCFLGYFIQSRSCDAVLIEGSSEGYRMLPVLRSMFPKIPIIDYLHFVTPEWMQGGFPKLSILYKAFIDSTFTSCVQLRDWMIESGADAGRVDVCYIGVDNQVWKPDPVNRAQVRKELGIGINDTVILYAARLEEQKQPAVFADTLNKLLENGDEFHALVAGEGSLRAELEKQLRVHKLKDKIHMLGSVPVDKMPAIMSASDIFFLPSKNEGISQALFEAMASGLVVVGAQVGGQDEVVTADCGILYSHRDQEYEAGEYAKILHHLINDSSQKQQMSQASRKRVIERFSLSLMGEHIHQSLYEVIENKKDRFYEPYSDLTKQAIYRETQTYVEYLQVRRELRKVSQQLSQLVIPRKPSHWFYLWIRQLFLPTYNWFTHTKISNFVVDLKGKIKILLVREP